MIMKVRIILSTLLFCSLILPSQVMGADITDGDWEPAISVAINNIVRHEKRFLSTSDIFDINLYPEQNLLVVSARVDDEYHNHYLAIVSPKDTTIKPEYIHEEEKLVWVSPVSKDTIMTCSNCFSEDFSLSYLPDYVMIDYSELPNKVSNSANKLFYWRDEASPESKVIIDKLVDMGRVDFLSRENILGWGVLNEGDEVVCYELDALQKGIIKKFHNYGLWGNGFRARFRRGWFQLWHPQRDYIELRKARGGERYLEEVK